VDVYRFLFFFFFFQAEDGIRDFHVTGVQTCALPICQLAGQAAGVHRRLAPGEFAGLARGLASARRVDALADDAARDGRMLVKVLAQALVYQLLDLALDIAVELALGLPLELRLRQLDRDDRHQALADVIPSNGDFIFL